MKQAWKPIRTVAHAVVVLGLALLLAGCVSTPPVDWSARVGQYTHDEAVTAMGPPDKSARLTNGVVVAEWLVQHGQAHTYAMASQQGYIYQRLDVLTPRDRFLRLTFGADGVLREWEHMWR